MFTRFIFHPFVVQQSLGSRTGAIVGRRWSSADFTDWCCAPRHLEHFVGITVQVMGSEFIASFAEAPRVTLVIAYVVGWSLCL